MRNRGAFTLIELMVVVAIIGLLVAIALPALSGARKSAALAVSQANLRSMHNVLASWSANNKSEFYNPFSDQRKENNLGFNYWEHNRYRTEGLAAYWFSYINGASEANTLGVETFLSPADGDAVRQYKDRGPVQDGEVFAGSYYYSPTMWKDPAMYDFQRRPQSCPGYGPEYRMDCCVGPDHPLKCAAPSHNSLDATAFPSAKVIVFERADFGQKSRVQISGTQSVTRPVCPAWNNPRAKPSVATMDGSVTKADIGDLTRRAADALRNDPMLNFLPVDLLSAPDSLPRVHLPSGSAVIDGPFQGDGLYPMFFAATRYGIKGRDLPR